jgi:hypothetical protein
MKDVLIKDVQELSVRTRNALRTAGFLRTSDLDHINLMDLRIIYGIGVKGRNDIIAFCNKNSIAPNQSNCSIKYCVQTEYSYLSLSR